MTREPQKIVKSSVFLGFNPKTKFTLDFISVLHRNHVSDSHRVDHESEVVAKLSHGQQQMNMRKIFE